jgi:hypothetical protein
MPTGNDIALTVPNEVMEIMFGTTPMTIDERDKAVSIFRVSGAVQRQIGLALFERKAHEVPGAKMPWDKFCTDLLGLSDASYAYDLLRWARVERRVFDLGISVMTEIPKVSQRVALEIAKLPDDQWKGVYQEYERKQKQGKRSSTSLLNDLKEIVQTALIPPAIAPVKARVPLRPIVPPTYDRGPEFDDEPIPEAEAAETVTFDVEDAELLAEANADHERLDALIDAEETAADINAPHKYPATDLPTIAKDDGTLLLEAREIIRQFRYAVKVANQDLMYEADAAAAKFEKEFDAKRL